MVWIPRMLLWAAVAEVPCPRLRPEIAQVRKPQSQIVEVVRLVAELRYGVVVQTERITRRSVYRAEAVIWKIRDGPCVI